MKLIEGIAMKRDMDLVRKILIEMETWTPEQRGDLVTVEGYTAEEVMYHLGLMNQAGLIKAIDASSHDGEAWLPISILWDGHEFLDAARSDTLWNKAKETVIKNTGALTLEALKVVLAALVKHAAMGA